MDTKELDHDNNTVLHVTLQCEYCYSDVADILTRYIYP
jgi:hypothetical protein